MFRVFKTFLLWLLIAALPIQGAAAVIKASCGPRHHGVSIEASVSDHHHSVGTLAHGDVSAEMVAVDNEAVVAFALTEQADSSPKLPVSSFCSACAACCAGAVAPPPSLSLTPTFLVVEAAVLPPVVSFTGFIPAGPERPPRHLSA